MKKDVIYQKIKILIEEYMIYSGTYTLIKADVPEFFRRLKIVIIYKKYLYVYDNYREKQFEKADYEC